LPGTSVGTEVSVIFYIYLDRATTTTTTEELNQIPQTSSNVLESEDVVSSKYISS
jgi:hypothetical protein